MATQIEGDSPEAVALRLLENIRDAEGKSFALRPSEGYTSADRRWILDTYAECIKTVRLGTHKASS